MFKRIAMKEEKCPGLFEPCFAPVTNHLVDPDGVEAPVPLCAEHWEWTMELEERLNEESEFAKRFADALADTLNEIKN